MCRFSISRTPTSRPKKSFRPLLERIGRFSHEVRRTGAEARVARTRESYAASMGSGAPTYSVQGNALPMLARLRSSFLVHRRACCTQRHLGRHTFVPHGCLKLSSSEMAEEGQAKTFRWYTRDPLSQKKGPSMDSCLMWRTKKL